MKIAILAWGSLVWDSKCLKFTGGWNSDGPNLPVEFARISKNGRLTLVILKGADYLQTLWAYSSFEDLDIAIDNLRKREGPTITENIGYIRVDSGVYRCNTFPSIVSGIKKWADRKSIDAVVWTDLPSNFENETMMPLTENNVLSYLKQLDNTSRESAEKYIRKTPSQIRTKFRSAIETELGWTCLSDI